MSGLGYKASEMAEGEVCFDGKYGVDDLVVLQILSLEVMKQACRSWNALVAGPPDKGSQEASSGTSIASCSPACPIRRLSKGSLATQSVMMFENQLKRLRRKCNRG